MPSSCLKYLGKNTPAQLELIALQKYSLILTCCYWLQASWTNFRVCAQHFAKECFTEVRNETRGRPTTQKLLPNAVPSPFLPPVEPENRSPPPKKLNLSSLTKGSQCRMSNQDQIISTDPTTNHEHKMSYCNLIQGMLCDNENRFL